MVRLYMLLFAVEIVLGICALISCLSTEEREIRALPRIAWVLIILFFPLVGSIAWFVAGRASAAAPPAKTWRTGGGFPERERPRPMAPDDDPEFLRSLNPPKDRDVQRRSEEDLRRREEELRKRDGREPPAEERPKG
jgi:hypothetical protein